MKLIFVGPENKTYAKLIRKEIYTLELSADPKISVVVTEIFYETKIQKQKYEKEFLPDLMKEARENLK